MSSVLNDVKPMDFNNAVQLPDSHAWIDDPLNTSPNGESVPVIDLDDPKALEKIRKAFETWGFFQLINHGVPLALLAQMDHQVRRFFELPKEQKLRALRSPDSSTGYGIVPSSRFFNSLMWGEGFTAIGSPLEHARKVWPQDYSSFCTVIDEYQEQMRSLAEKISALAFKSLGLSAEDVEWFKPNESSKTTQSSLLQMNSYPGCPNPNRAMGLAPHTDSSLITVLYQDSSIRGLQVYRPDLGWVDVEPIPNALVVNVGDLMQIASNGQFKSLLHRAVVTKANHRISVAYFFGPNKEVKISPPLKLVKDGDFPRYRSISWKEYLDVKGVHFFNALEKIPFNSVAEETNALTSGND